MNNIIQEILICAHICVCSVFILLEELCRKYNLELKFKKIILGKCHLLHIRDLTACQNVCHHVTELP